MRAQAADGETGTRATPPAVAAEGAGDPAQGYVPGRYRLVETRRWPAPEARQGVAADREYIYVITNHGFGKYRKDTKERVGGWEGPEDGPIRHLNAAVVREGRLYCAHSNYPEVPMTSSVEVWDTETLEHLASHSFGIAYGSLTWIDEREGDWYACFAHYGNRAAEPGKDPAWTQLVRFDRQWRRLEGWVFPPELLRQFEAYSSSGGAFGPEGLLYVAGHDRQELYLLRLPRMGSVLEWVDTLAMGAEGQAFGWDPEDPEVLYTILKRERAVIESRREKIGP